jgi:hypothetical protein
MIQPRKLFRAVTLLRSLAIVALVFVFTAPTITPSFAAGGVTGSVTGSVIQADGKTPLANAQITVTSPSVRASTTSDAHGFFTFQQLPVDTYVVTIASPGYQTLSITGLTVQGDQNVTLKPQSLVKQLATIGRVTSRSASSVVQPNQTVDQVTISGDRLTEASGKAFNTNIAILAQSIPGVTLTAGGNISIRGSRTTDVGFQFEGVDFREPQANAIAANSLNGLASLQVVGGTGDASQGNVGAGVINFTVKRGARPDFGSLDLEARGPYYGHQLATEYGFATPDGRITDYFSYVGQRNGTTCGPVSDPVINGCFTTTSFQKLDDSINNFVYRFGRDNTQSLQVLARFRRSDTLGQLGGVSGGPLSSGCPSPSAAAAAAACIPFQYYTNDPRYQAIAGSLGLTGSQFVSQVPLLTSAVPIPGQNVVPTTPADSANANLGFLLFTYSRPIGAETTFTGRYYNWQSISVDDFTHGGVLTEPFVSNDGGTTGGYNFDLTSQLGDKHTLDLAGKFENSRPDRTEPDAYLGLLGPSGNGDFGTLNFNQWLNPANTAAPVSAANPCPVAASVDPTACYLYSQGFAIGGASFWGPGGVGRIPVAGVGYRSSDYQTYGLGIHDLFVLNAKARFDFGFRVDGANYKQATNQYGQLDPTGLTGVTPDNPQDVDPSTVTAKFRTPKVYSPRIAGSFQLTPLDSVRLGYGRSVNFNPGQGFGTPWTLYGAPAQLSLIPALDSAANPQCGSGVNTARGAALGQTPTAGGATGFFQCANFANQLYWADEQVDAPDVGGSLPPTYSNWDLTYQHQFKNGWGLRLTGYAKRGFDLASLSILRAGPPDPATLQPSYTIYGAGSNGLEKTAGADFYIATPDRPAGFSGFLTLTYTNAISNVPPGAVGEESIDPLYNAAAGALNATYREGFISPLVGRLGLTYKTHNGFRINPIIAYDNGYPVGVGNTTPFGGNTAYAVGSVPTLNGQILSVTATNLGLAQPYAYGNGTGYLVTPNYVDPVNPGSYLSPVIAATRGTNEGSNTGSLLSKARVGADISFEFTKNRNTFGLYIANISNNEFGLGATNSGNEPTPNTRYQAVANGVAGPQTGTVNGIIPNSTSVSNLNQYNYGVQPFTVAQGGRGAYYIPFTTNATPRSYRLYYQLAF